MAGAGRKPLVHVVGGGLAGPEAAHQIARTGCRVVLYEMRPRISTPAHRTGALGELVCSNSLKSEAPHSAPWLLKQELRAGGSLLLACADQAAVPGGQALAVDRVAFSAAIEAALGADPDIEIRREEVTALAPLAPGPVVVASGPLTSAPLAAELGRHSGAAGLFFYDAISPIVEADSVDRAQAFAASRYGRGGDDYLNCPMDRPQFEHFCAALRAAESYPLHAGEAPRYFEACLPLEELARRGPETLRFGPFKPVGLVDPRTGRRPYAAVQLRRENRRADSFNLVGCQNHLRTGEQARILRLIPGLENARFLRFGQVHRNTYLDAPRVLNGQLQLAAAPSGDPERPVFAAGQLCGTEGYIEAMATGWLAGRFAAAVALGRRLPPPPRASALGSLLHYMAPHAAGADAPPPDAYVPANMTFDLLPRESAENAIRDRSARHQAQCARALTAFTAWHAAL
ncbi:MAG: methylenetetrahydrofolate--tRNA-(uracil(54)-C(5))-methyltransferase (FADH(2)-oxidizing) TrmFO [Terriglobales bacterium]